jgi:hypothetical protein
LIEVVDVERKRRGKEKRQKSVKGRRGGERGRRGKEENERESQEDSIRRRDVGTSRKKGVEGIRIRRHQRPTEPPTTVTVPILFALGPGTRSMATG